ncbi:MAG: hypothetical protein RRC34_01605 [Lentisphaeria bacterium]|nr:hypothetical protein [Lentisphaeria bacterium]
MTCPRHHVSQFVCRLLVGLCLTWGLASAAAADDIRCAACGKPIAGRYYMVDGRPYCARPECHASTLPTCAECGRRVGPRYIQAGDKAFCGEACLTRSLPVCSVCHQRMRGQYKVLNGKKYCSQACMDTAVPKCERCRSPLYQSVIINGHGFCLECGKQPACWGCRLPRPLTKKLGDGRSLCADCARGAVLSREKAEELYMIARHEQKRVTGTISPTLPVLRLVGQDVLKTEAPENADLDAVQWGVYRREITTRVTTRGMPKKPPTTDITRTRETVFILGGLNRENFITTAVHELTHDLLAENHPDVATKAPNWVEEGICQYVAAAVCLLNGWFDELKAIESAPDNDYGGGYRFFKRTFGDADWDDVVDWMNTVDVTTLPTVPPPK